MEREMTWTDELHYQNLAARYNDTARPYVSQFDYKLAQACKPVDFSALRRAFQADYEAYKRQLDAEGARIATGGVAGVMQQNLEAMLKLAKKLRPTKKQRKEVDMHGKYFDPWFDVIMLKFSGSRMTICTPVLDGCDYAWVSLTVSCVAAVEQPFAVLLDFATLYDVVKLLDRKRIDLRYRCLVGRLEIKQWHSRINLVCADPGKVPQADSFLL